MPTKFSTSGNRVFIMDYNEETLKDTLEPKIYKVCYDEMIGYYLNIMKSKFDTPETIFGNIETKVDKVISTYHSRATSTGVLATGIKGAGKTILIELIANKLIDQGIPVVMVDEPFSDGNFTMFIEQIGECVLLFDEVAKIYQNDNGDGRMSENPTLLKLLDGTNSSKRLVLLTENEAYNINEFILDRPGRVFYHFKYEKLSEDIIHDYCNYHNINNKIADDIISVSSYTNGFSFDTLKAIVEEYLRFPDENIEDMITDLNIATDSDMQQMTILKLINKKY